MVLSVDFKQIRLPIQAELNRCFFNNFPVDTTTLVQSYLIFQSLVSELSYDINFKLKRDFEDQLHNITLTTGNCLIQEILSYVAVIVQEMNELFSFVKEH